VKGDLTFRRAVKALEAVYPESLTAKELCEKAAEFHPQWPPSSPNKIAASIRQYGGGTVEVVAGKRPLRYRLNVTPNFSLESRLRENAKARGFSPFEGGAIANPEPSLVGQNTRTGGVGEKEAVKTPDCPRRGRILNPAEDDRRGA